jgi:arabinan endo-1,5-alpha-L-arabinosidase
MAASLNSPGCSDMPSLGTSISMSGTPMPHIRAIPCCRLLPQLLMVLWLLQAGAIVFAQDQPPQQDSNDTESERRRRRQRAPDPENIHDPSSIVADDGVLRCFCTGRGISLMRENSEGRWLPESKLFADGEFPAWHGELVPGNRGHLWAPDVIRSGDKYFVYYSVSTFGKNTSAIGLAAGDALDPASPQWDWEDRGPVIQSRSGDPFNAIDPAVFRDPEDDSLWLAFGSFWDGLHLVELDSTSGLRRDAGAAPVRLASAPEIEAPFLHYRDGFYYLFLNWGKCCRGVASTYEIRVGRSRSVTGPYTDHNGTDLRDQGGSLVLDSHERWIGPGHASLLTRDGGEWLVHHYYDAEVDGHPRLRMLPLSWDAEGWPIVTVDAQ